MIRMIKPRGVRWLGDAESNGEIRNAYRTSQSVNANRTYYMTDIEIYGKNS
jgi:hypothetical protein